MSLHFTLSFHMMTVCRALVSHCRAYFYVFDLTRPLSTNRLELMTSQSNQWATVTEHDDEEMTKSFHSLYQVKVSPNRMTWPQLCHVVGHLFPSPVTCVEFHQVCQTKHGQQGYQNFGEHGVSKFPRHCNDIEVYSTFYFRLKFLKTHKIVMWRKIKMFCHSYNLMLFLSV